MNTFYTYPNQSFLFSHYFNALSPTDQSQILGKLISCLSLDDLLIPLTEYFYLCGHGNKRIIPLDNAKDYFTNKELRIVPLPLVEKQYFLLLDSQLFAFHEEEEECQEIPLTIHIGLALTNTNRILVISGIVYESYIHVSIYDPTTSLTDKHCKSFLLTEGLPYLMLLMPKYTSQVYELVNLIYTRCFAFNLKYINKDYEDIQEIALALNTSSHFRDEFIEVTIDNFTKRGDYLILTQGNHKKRARLIRSKLTPISGSPNSFRIRSKVTLKDDFDMIIFKVYEPEPSKNYHYICLTNPHDFRPIEGSSFNSLNPTIRFTKKEDGSFEFAEKGISRIHTNLNYIPLHQLAPLLRQ